MSKVERGQFSSLMRRYLGMAGSSDVLDELAPEMSASLTLESERPEWEFLKGAKLLSAVATIPPLAGNSAAVRLRNPIGTDVGGFGSVVGVMQSIWFSVGVTAEVRVTIGNDAGNLTTTFSSTPRDTRFPRVAFPGNSALICSGDYGLNGDQVWDLSCIAFTPVEITTPYVITPGFQMQVTSITVNVGLQVVYSWLEKRLDVLEQR